jgi:hypothetical protein
MLIIIRKWKPNAKDGELLKPDEVSNEILHLINQPKSTWTFELDLRPFSEKWQ